MLRRAADRLNDMPEKPSEESKSISDGGGVKKGHGFTVVPVEAVIPGHIESKSSHVDVDVGMEAAGLFSPSEGEEEDGSERLFSRLGTNLASLSISREESVDTTTKMGNSFSSPVQSPSRTSKTQPTPVSVPVTKHTSNTTDVLDFATIYDKNDIKSGPNDFQYQFSPMASGKQRGRVSQHWEQLTAARKSPLLRRDDESDVSSKIQQAYVQNNNRGTQDSEVLYTTFEGKGSSSPINLNQLTVSGVNPMLSSKGKYGSAKSPKASSSSKIGEGIYGSIH